MATTLPISVIIPAYNRAAQLPRALASVAAQAPYRPAEVIVVDDHSSDDSAAVASDLGATVIRHESNRGAAAARNTAAAAASSSWLALLDSDDEWLPGHLDRCFHAAADHVLVAEAALTRGESRARLLGHPSSAAVSLESPRPLMFPENFVVASAALVRRDALLAAGGFRSHVFGEDLDLWIRVLERGRGVVLPSVGCWYHIHPDQATTDKQGLWTGRADVWADYRGRSWFSNAAANKLRAVTYWDSRPSTGPSSAKLRWALEPLRDPWKAIGLPEMLAWRRRRRNRTAHAQAELRSSPA
jgi:glycosyltransferase involved in cell wall biosynthesis